MTEITEFVCGRYGHLGGEGQRMIQFMENLWTHYRDFADPHFISEFCSGDEDRYLERFWEMLLTCDLLEKSLPVESAPAGPDIKIAFDGQTTWVEAVVAGIGAGNNRLPDAYVNPARNENGVAVYDVPHEQILLRWTAAIGAKVQKFNEYRQLGLVAPDDCCVIAVNSCRLRHGGFDGISQFPAALEAVYPLGPQQVHIDRSTMEVTDTTIAYRPAVINANASEVPTDTFLNADFSGISGILAASKNADQALLGFGRNLIYVHNINADHPVPHGLFQVAQEFWVEEIGDGAYQIRDSTEDTEADT